MEFSNSELFFYGGCLLFIVTMVIVIIIATRYHVYKAPFRPKYVSLSDGSLQMEFYEFGGLQSSRTERFKKEFYIGKEVEYQNKKYRIAQIKDVKYISAARVNDVKMVAYLEDIL